MHYKTLLTLIVILGCCDGARILAVVPTPAYSHQVAFHPLWKTLSQRGHKVTLITTDPIKDASLSNLTQINTSGLYEKIENDSKNVIKSNSIIGLLTIITTIAEFHLSHPKVQGLIKNENENFDVVIVEFVNPFVLAYGERFKCPIILVTSLQTFTWIDVIMGNPQHPAIYSDTAFEFDNELTLYNRLCSVLYNIMMRLVYKFYIVPKQQVLVHKYFGENYPYIDDMAQNVSLVLTNSDVVFHKIKPLLPNIVQIGGPINTPTPSPLPKEVKGALDAAKKGFVYFSLGSNAKSKDLSKETITILLETFAELPYTVLWKFEEDNVLNKPDNVITSKWLPQLNVLRHPNIKLFITQGGLQSMEEAIYSHIPMIGMPIFADQQYNVKEMSKRGFGLSINMKTLTKEELKEKVLEVINNPR
ncbi:hypothetical protein FQA39_LY15729 [Lamprigera yunnana]|nr:hypothetical protein FQA39_LY15729 [Lamprigera yunnana]